MNIIGIICEYNPLHTGHKKQLDIIRQLQGEDCGIVCLMSGSFVQRGAPAIFPKAHRAQAAISCGADLVLELPITGALSSAEGFAQHGVSILSRLCTHLCFGAEQPEVNAILATAHALCREDFPMYLRQALDTGVSFPAARQLALEAMGCDSTLLTQPNNILAVEYCKAILQQNSALQPIPIFRGGDYHDTLPDAKNPSATALRQRITNGDSWEEFVPAAAADIFRDAPLHTLQSGERAMLAILRRMADTDFSQLPYGSEGLWRKLMHACRSSQTLEEIIATTKSKRYTRTRIDRMLMCAFLGLTQADLAAPSPYTRILAFNEKGRSILSKEKKSGFFVNTGQVIDSPYQQLETRCEDLYGLFRQDSPAPAGQEKKARIYYQQS